MRFAIGADLGGTNLRVAAVSEKGEISHRVKVPSEASKGKRHVVDLIVSHVNSLKGKLSGEGVKVAGIGIGIPGIVDSTKGIVYQSPHFHDWLNFKIEAELEKGIKEKISIDNDANMIALGEKWKGAGEGFKNFIMLTLGTGIGGGIIINDKIFHGDSGFAGEVGHIVIEREGNTCNCGGKGCWETYASASGMKKMIDSSGDDLSRKEFLKRFNGGLAKVTAEEIYHAARDGDIFAASLFKKFGAYLGIGIASLVNTTGIETMIIGGGLKNAWDFFIPEAEREIKRRIYKETAGRIKILPARLGDDAGILGSACMGTGYSFYDSHV